MNPSLQTTKDLVKVAAHIDTDAAHYFIKFHNLKYYMQANQEAIRLDNTRPLFTNKGLTNDLFSQYKAQIEENRREKKPIYEGLPLTLKQVSLDSFVQKDVELGEKSQISKSSIGRGVKVGARSKIVNSVIMNHVTIGSE